MDNEDRKRWSAEYARANGEDKATSPYPPIPPLAALRIGPDELAIARITPPCIVESYLYRDVATFPGPGGTGKTTLFLFESVHIVLGRPLYGLDVVTPGVVAFVTAEDRRELLVARLREIMEAMDLSAEEQATVCARVLIWDVTGSTCRLTELDAHGNVVLTGLADAIVEHFRPEAPVMLGLDPVISFGAGERIVNDNEHSLILAARRIVCGLGCCVRLICHTGKENARNWVIDQYAGRGGSALADGSRMVAVVQAWEAADTDKLTPPIGFTLAADESGLILARAKLSFVPKHQRPYIWLKRRWYSFEHFIDTPADPEAESRERADQLERYLIEKFKAGYRFTQNMLQDMGDVKMKRKDLRDALAMLRATRRVVLEPLPEEERQGGRQNYLHPTKVPTAPDLAAAGGAVGTEEGPATGPEPPDSTTEPPLRKREVGAVVHADPLSLFPHRAGQQLAQFGAVGAVEGNDSTCRRCSGEGCDWCGGMGRIVADEPEEPRP